MLLTPQERKTFIDYCTQQKLDNLMLAKLLDPLEAYNDPLASRKRKLAVAYTLVSEDLSNVEEQSHDPLHLD